MKLKNKPELITKHMDRIKKPDIHWNLKGYTNIFLKDNWNTEPLDYDAIDNVYYYLNHKKQRIIIDGWTSEMQDKHLKLEAQRTGTNNLK